MELEDIRTEIYKLRSNINSLATKLTAADYGREADVERVVKDMNTLKEQVNMLLHFVAPIEEIHKKSLHIETSQKRLEMRQKKQDDLKKLLPIEASRHAWLPLFAIIQLALSWALYFK